MGSSTNEYGLQALSRALMCSSDPKSVHNNRPHQWQGNTVCWGWNLYPWLFDSHAPWLLKSWAFVLIGKNKLGKEKGGGGKKREYKRSYLAERRSQPWRVGPSVVATSSELCGFQAVLPRLCMLSALFMVDVTTASPLGFKWDQKGDLSW